MQNITGTTNVDDIEFVFEVIEFSEPADGGNGFSNTSYNMIAKNSNRAISNKSQEILINAKKAITRIAEEYGDMLNAMQNRPDTLELELSLAISTKGEICIVSFEGAASFKVKLMWNQKE